MKNVSGIGARVARGTVVLAMLAGGFGITAAEAAPIGVPAATTGAGKTTVGGEINLLLDRDLDGTSIEAESSQVFATGTLGVDDRLDLVFRLGLGDVTISTPTGDVDTDLGPAFGVGFKVTWATIRDANLKVGSVFQTTRIRADRADQVPGQPTRASWSEYDAALGVAFDTGGSVDPKKRTTEFALMPYGGFAWSGVDNGVAGGREDDSFGLFGGLAAKAGGGFGFGVELRLVDQTALSLGASMAF
jgi:hypothetical protein